MQECGHTLMVHVDNASQELIDDPVQWLIEFCTLRGGFTRAPVYDVHIVGGFEEPKYSEKISKLLLTYFAKHSCTFHLQNAVITTLNTTVKDNNALPRLYGLCISVRDGTVFVPDYGDEEPLKTLRSTRHSYGDSDILRITDPTTNHIVIEPFHYTAIGTSWMKQVVELAPDEWILANLSTSPKAEKANFVSHVRNVMCYLLEHPNSEEVFKNGRFEFALSEKGFWEAVMK